ncbi:MAG: thioredoxin [Dehalococcoidia bacterium]
MSHAIDATDANFGDTVRRSDTPTLVDFWAPWCGPCRLLGPVVDRVAEQYADHLRVVRVDVDTSPALAQAHGVRSIPTLILFKGGEPVARIVGLVSFDDLASRLDAELGMSNAAA